MSPARKVAMLYDRAIGALKDVIQAIEANEIERRWRSNRLAGEIIEILWATLDIERGGEIAANLDRLYSFMLQHLAAVDFKNDPKPAQDVIDLLEPLRQSWHELARRAEAEASASRPQVLPNQAAPGADAAEPPQRLVLSA